MLHLFIYFFKVGPFACRYLNCWLTKTVPASTFNTWSPHHPHHPPLWLYRASLFLSFPACRHFVSCLTVRTTSVHFVYILICDLSDSLPHLFLLETTQYLYNSAILCVSGECALWRAPGLWSPTCWFHQRRVLPNSRHLCWVKSYGIKPSPSFCHDHQLVTSGEMVDKEEPHWLHPTYNHLYEFPFKKRLCILIFLFFKVLLKLKLVTIQCNISVRCSTPHIHHPALLRSVHF